MKTVAIMPQSYIFTITTGRSGTAYLSKLLDVNLVDAEVHHEILHYGAFGVDSPDVSQLTAFNALGNTELVQSFWRRKFARILKKTVSVYAETSHVLAKAGLFENITPLTQQADVYVVLLHRPIVKIACSLLSRYDLLNKGNMWLWYLDPDYPNLIVNPSSFPGRGWVENCVWYVCEMFAPAEYYRMLFADSPNIKFVDVSIEDLNIKENAEALFENLGNISRHSETIVPPPQNVISLGKLAHGTIQDIENLVRAMDFDPKELASNFLESGRRLGIPLIPTIQTS